MILDQSGIFKALTMGYHLKIRGLTNGSIMEERTNMDEFLEREILVKQVHDRSVQQRPDSMGAPWSR